MNPSETLTAVRSRGVKIDYAWEGTPEAAAKASKCANLGDNTYPTIVLRRSEDGSWRLLADSLASGRKDFSGTPIRNTFFWERLPETEARGLASLFLSKWDYCARLLARAIMDGTKEEKRGWKCDWSEAGAILNQMLAEAVKGCESPTGTLEGRLQRPHGGVGSPEWHSLAADLRKYSLPTSPDATMVVTDYPSDLDDARETAFRLYFRDADSCNLDKKKGPTQNPSQYAKPRQRSTTPVASSKTFSTLLVDFLLSRTGLLVVFGLLLLLLSKLMFGGSDKKKEIQRLGFSEVEQKGDLTFSVDDLANLPLLASKLNQSSRAFDTWLKGQLSFETTEALKASAGPNFDPAPLKSLLLRDLNRLRVGASVYELQRFTGVELRRETQLLVPQASRNEDFSRLNRLLIEDAFPLELRRNQKKTVRLVITFGKVKSDELNRAPDLQTPQGWSAEPKGWDLASRSWCVQLTSSDSKRDVRFTIAFPFEVGEQLPEINSPPAWTVGREWQGQKMVVNVHMAGATP